MSSDKDIWLELLKSEVPPVKLGNDNKSGECGMCGRKAANKMKTNKETVTRGLMDRS